jgi:hypothetical protein
MTVGGTPMPGTRPAGTDMPCAGVLDCQLQILFEATTPATLPIRVRSLALRVESYLRDHLDEARLRLGKLQTWMRRAPDTRRPPEEDPIETGARLGTVRGGDRVRVLPASEIHRTLDENGRYDGLRFMKGMEEYCGQTFTVLRRVQAIFDERAWQMRRIRGTVLLKDVVCTGRYMGDREGCDRCCFFFWKEQWLRQA